MKENYKVRQQHYSKFQRWNRKLIPTDSQCPGDGSCSGNGWCDQTNGICNCLKGFQGNKCQGNSFH